MSEPASNVVALPHGRVPPHNLDAEKSLLGGLLLDGEAIDDVLELVKGADFYRDAHRRVFEVMVDLHAHGEPIDRVQVKNKLLKLGVLEAAGGEDFIDLLDKIVPTAANLEYYATIIADKALARRFIEAATKVAQLGYEQHGDVHEFADSSEALFFSLRQQNIRGEFKTIGQVLPGVFHEIEERCARGDALVGVTSGLDALDDMTSGFRPADLVVIAARPGIGKTALALGISIAITKTGGAVPFFSLEMSREELTVRALSAISGVNSKNIDNGRLSDNDWGKLAAAASKLAELPLYILSKDEVSAGEIRAHSRRLAKKLAKTKTPLAAIVIDYLQLMYVDADAERRDVAIAANTRQLKGLATQLQVPVLLLAQLNREVEKRPGKRPQASDLRESGAIENDADLILFIYREEHYKATAENKGLAEIIIGKQRKGPTGVVKVEFVKECSAFRNRYELPPEPEQMALPAGPPGEEPPPPEER